MTEQEKLHHAKHYIDSLANGLNPLDGTPIPEQDIVNNVKISRCLFFVSDVLRKQLDGHKPKTQIEIAKEMGISRSYVSRIETKAISKLSKEIKE